MTTQENKIKESKRAYILDLSLHSKGMTDRFSIYVDNGNGLDVLWPSDSHDGVNFKDKLPSQVYSKDKKYPSFHFKLKGYGYSKFYELKTMLLSINPTIEVFRIGSGHSPSSN